MVAMKHGEIERRAPLTVFGVQYEHIQLRDGGELFLTPFGVPWVENLMPDMFWTDKQWFSANSTKLFGHSHRSGGSGTVYRVRTKPKNGKSKEIVVKWNRMAQDVPGNRDHDQLLTVEFNSPFEEFSLLLEMRDAWRQFNEKRIFTHKPLAVYVPAETVDPDRLGRKEHRMRDIIEKHPEVKLDLFRRYAVVYEWIKGIDLQELCRKDVVSSEEMAQMTISVDQDLSRLGFAVRDRKPQHIICRVDKAKGTLQGRGRAFSYALVDFELLERTPEREKLVKAARRRKYLEHQARRFEKNGEGAFPHHLDSMKVMGVDYVFGTAESTGGRLWVVGQDPLLFDYFLPERWEHTPRTKLSPDDEVYETVTRDDIHIVWKLSHVGAYPAVDPFDVRGRRILEHGYNSPFEKVAIALELQSKGVPVSMPRAIYETHHRSTRNTVFGDQSRYISHEHLRTADGTRILRQDRDYIIIWGYWNKPDPALAEDDRDHYEPVDALRALHTGILSYDEYMSLMQHTKEKMQAAGVEDLSFSGRHKLLSLTSAGTLMRDEAGMPEVRISNFELVRRIV